MNIGPFEILATIGGGGSGIVYKARNQTLGRVVAIKQLHKSVNEGDRLFTRFQREARIMASVRSPHVVTVYSFQIIDGRPLLEMECLEHGSLETLITASAQPFYRVLAVVEDLLAGLQALHEAGVVHRDVKPGNVLQDEGGRYKLTDFGISTVESGGKATLEAATIRYLAPECVAEQPVCDARSDLYSVGMLAYELLLGSDGLREAFARLTPIAAFAPRWLEWIRDTTQDAASLHTLRPDIPVPVSHFIARLMAKDRDVRFVSADAALRALRLLPYTRRLSNDAAPAVPPSEEPAERPATAGERQAGWALKVRIARDGHPDATVSVSHSPVTIGSSPQCDIVLGDAYVSSEHARIVIARGTMTFVDQSRNGSFVRGQRVTQTAIGPQDEIGIPPFRLTCELEIHQPAETLHRLPREVAEAMSPPPPAPSPPVDDGGTVLFMPPAKTAPTPVLRLLKGAEFAGAETFPLAGERMIIGRGTRAEIRIDSTTVSRQHVELLRQRDGRWLALDLNSANGMAINGTRVARHVLAAGDVMAIGPEITLQYVVPEPGT